MALNWSSSSGLSLLSGENRLSDAAPAAGGAAAAPKPLVCPKLLPLPAAAAAGAAPAPKPLPNPPVLCAVAEKLNPEAEPNPDAGACVLEAGVLKEKEEAEGAAAAEPKSGAGWDGAAAALPKPAEGARAEPNPPPEEVKLKELAWAGAGAPKPEQGGTETKEKSAHRISLALVTLPISAELSVNHTILYLCSQSPMPWIQIQFLLLIRSRLRTPEAPGCLSLQAAATDNMFTLFMRYVIKKTAEQRRLQLSDSPQHCGWMDS